MWVLKHASDLLVTKETAKKASNRVSTTTRDDQWHYNENMRHCDSDLASMECGQEQWFWDFGSVNLFKVGFKGFIECFMSRRERCMERKCW